MRRAPSRVAANRLGLLLATSIGLLLFLLHLQWLPTLDFVPVDCAMRSSLGVHLGPLARLIESLRWLCEQLFNRALPAWLLLAVVVWRTPRIQAPLIAAPSIGVNLPPTRALRTCLGVLTLRAMALIGTACARRWQRFYANATPVQPKEAAPKRSMPRRRIDAAMTSPACSVDHP